MSSMRKNNIPYEESTLSTSTLLSSSLTSLLPAKKLFRTFTSNEDNETTVRDQGEVHEEYDLVESLQKHLHHWRQRALEAELRAIRATERYQLAEMENVTLHEEIHNLHASVEHYEQREYVEKNEPKDTAALHLLRSLESIWTLLLNVEYDALTSAKYNLWEETTIQFSKEVSKWHVADEPSISERDIISNKSENRNRKEQKVEVIEIDELKAEELSSSDSMQDNVASALATVNTACYNLRSWSVRCKQLLATLDNSNREDNIDIISDNIKERSLQKKQTN